MSNRSSIHLTMKQFTHYFLFIFLLSTMELMETSSAAASPARALVVPITKHLTPNPYYTLSFTHSNPTSYLLDLSGPFLWSPCPRRRHHPTIPCNSTTCALANTSPRRYCPHRAHPPLTKRTNSPSCTCKVCGSSDLTRTDLTLSSTDGHTPTAPVTVPDIVSACTLGPTAGIAGLSRSALSLPTQLSFSLDIKSQFAVCLPSTNSSAGVAFFGSGPFYLLPPTLFELSTRLSHTPLVKNPKNPSSYFINLRGIAVGGNSVEFLSRVLSFDSLGHGGVQLSTAAPYTVMRTHVYVPFLRAFARATRGIPRAPRVGPFGLCLNSTALGYTRVGYGVPQVDLMLPGGKNWTVFGANSMKQVGEETACLAFVDGGRKAEKAVVVGAYQMEDNLMLFDVGKSSLGFSSSLLFFRTTCGNFNFTASAA